MNTRETLDHVLDQAAAIGGPAAPYIRLGQTLAKLALELVQAGHTPAEIRKRLADGVQREDVVSDEALEDARAATLKVNDYLEGLD